MECCWLFLAHKVLSNGDKKDNLLRHCRVGYCIRSTSIDFADDFAYFFSGQVLIYLKADYPLRSLLDTTLLRRVRHSLLLLLIPETCYRILSSCKSVKITRTAFPKPETTGPIKKYIVWQSLFVWLLQWNYSNTPWENIYLLSKIYKMLHVLKRSWKVL